LKKKKGSAKDKDKDKNKKFLKKKDSTADPLSPRSIPADIKDKKSPEPSTARTSSAAHIPKMPANEGPKPPSDELQLGSIVHMSRDPDDLQQTITLLESKLVSLSNINCALQSQIDDLNEAFNRIRYERDELKRNLDETSQELDQYRKKKKEKK